MKSPALYCIHKHKEPERCWVPHREKSTAASDLTASGLLLELSKLPAILQAGIYFCWAFAFQTQHSYSWGWAEHPFGSSKVTGWSLLWNTWCPLEKCDPNKKTTCWESSNQSGVLKLIYLCEGSNESQRKFRIIFLPPEGLFLASLRTVQYDKR